MEFEAQNWRATKLPSDIITTIASYNKVEILGEFAKPNSGTNRNKEEKSRTPHAKRLERARQMHN